MSLPERDTDMIPPRPKFTPQQVAAFFGVHPNTLYLWVKKGLISYQRIETRIFFTPEDLEEFERRTYHPLELPRK